MVPGIHIDSKKLAYCKISNIRGTKSQMLNDSSLGLQLYLSNPLKMLSREWRCSWSSAGRRCSNFIWVFRQLYCLLRCVLLQVWRYFGTKYETAKQRFKNVLIKICSWQVKIFIVSYFVAKWANFLLYVSLECTYVMMCSAYDEMLSFYCLFCIPLYCALIFTFCPLWRSHSWCSLLPASNHTCSQRGVRCSIKMPSFLYRKSHYKDKIDGLLQNRWNSNADGALHWCYISFAWKHQDDHMTVSSYNGNWYT